MLSFIPRRLRRATQIPAATPARDVRPCKMESLESRLLFTVLTFDSATTQWANYTALPQTYGDRVTAATQNGFKYGTAGGTTPNVLAQYGTTGTGASMADTWQKLYGDLTNIIFPYPNGTKFQMTLTADSGFNVSLSSFDMAGYYQADHTIANLKVTDGAGKILFTQNNVLIKGAGPSHSHFTMASTVSAPKLIISYDSTNPGGGGYDTGIDNVQFSQSKIQTGSASGTVFNDVNGNGKKDTGDAGLAGWRVYVDSNNNGMYDSGENFVLTDANGNFSLKLAPGTYILSVQLKRGYYQTAPHALVYNLTITNNAVTGDLFGVKLISPA